MKGTKSWNCLLLAGLTLCAALALIGKWSRKDGEPRCTFDGLRIEPAYRVRIVDANGGSLYFCCVRCAAKWLDRQSSRPSAIYVTDEVASSEVESEQAVYVESAVITNWITGNHIHVFRSKAEADKHVRAYGGKVLPAAEHPFHRTASP